MEDYERALKKNSVYCDECGAPLDVEDRLLASRDDTTPLCEGCRDLDMELEEIG